ncbi:hypothetical protein LTR65_004534 [Meristemomyces frigidus]
MQGLQCAQGIINFAPNEPEDGGLVVLKGSHTLTEAFLKSHSMDKKAEGVAVPDDWHRFDAEEVAWFKQKDACYTPAASASSGELKQKAEIFGNRQRTTHWPHRNFWRQNKMLRFGEGDPYHRDRPFEEPVETEQLLKLAGALAC